MRRLTLFLFLMAVAAAPCMAVDESIATLKARGETALPEQRPDLFIRVAERQLREADHLYREGHFEEAQADVEDIATYSEKARDAAVTVKKHAKNIEIAARKISEKLRDIKRTLAFEDQAPLEKAIRRLEDVRTSLLKEMFSDKKDKKK
jgi:hypothetical protein